MGKSLKRCAFYILCSKYNIHYYVCLYKSVYLQKLLFNELPFSCTFWALFETRSCVGCTANLCTVKSKYKLRSRVESDCQVSFSVMQITNKISQLTDIWQMHCKHSKIPLIYSTHIAVGMVFLVAVIEILSAERRSRWLDETQYFFIVGFSAINLQQKYTPTG